jgi:transposase
MGRQSKIWRYKLEECVSDLYFNERLTLKEIAVKIKKEKNIAVSAEAVRRFINSDNLHGKTGDYIVKQG